MAAGHHINARRAKRFLRESTQFLARPFRPLSHWLRPNRTAAKHIRWNELKNGAFPWRNWGHAGGAGKL